MPWVRRIEPDDRQWAAEVLTRSWGSTRVVSRGRVHDASALPGLVAVLGDERAGLLTFSVQDDQCEVVTLDSLVERRGVGRALLTMAAHEAAGLGCRRLWLITTNDNLPALRFYQRLGWDLVALHRGAVDGARRLKPEIPQVGLDGIPLRHELELELLLPGADPQPAR
jgi:ribosomal protein S18 acetylase RimI-like enzyme